MTCSVSLLSARRLFSFARRLPISASSPASARPARPALPALPVAALALALAACATPVDAKKKPRALAQAAARDDNAPDVVTYGARDDVLRLGAEIAQRRGLDPAWVADALQRARFVPTVARLIMPPPAGTAKNWAAYRSRFVEPTRIRAGAEFWRANRKWLELAQELYGVPPEIVVGIIGVETIYSRQMGGFRVLDALATLSFDFPTGRRDRSAFFRSELEEFLVMCHSEGLDPAVPKGSYAGAMGMPQFMPSSFNKYAVDLDGDGHVDLAGSSADAIGSVAHYLAEFGWQRGMPTRFEVAAPVNTTDRALLLAPDIVPSFTVQEFEQRGAQLDAAALAYSVRFEAMRAATPTAAAGSAPASGAAAPAVSMGASSASASSAPSSAALASSAASASAAASTASMAAAAASSPSASSLSPASSATASLAPASSAATSPASAPPASMPPLPAAVTAPASAASAGLPDAAAALAPSPAASTSAATMSPSPATAAPAAPRVLKLALVELQNGDAAPSYIAGTPNFYVVTRYNWSSYYALAVIELGEAVAREVERDPAGSGR